MKVSACGLDNDENVIFPSSIELTVERVNAYGVGVATYDGVPHYIPFTLPGEVVRARPAGRRKKGVACELVELKRPSPLRTEPACVVYGVCGGCQLQHVSYEEQLRLKTAWVRAIFSRFSGVEINAIRPSPRPYGYRIRVTLHHDGRDFGFRGRGAHAIVPVKRCPVATDAVNAKIVALAGDVFAGPMSFEVREDGGAGFVQANALLNAALVEEIIASCGLRKGARALELYCGGGNFTVSLARTCREVVAVDGDAKAVERAGRMLRDNGVRNVKTTASDVVTALRGFVESYEVFDVVVCDPPRDGLGAAVGPLLRLKPRRLVYVSCEPRALAKDAAILERGGLRLKRLTPFDMFPQTHHIETVAVFSILASPPRSGNLPRAGTDPAGSG